MNKQIILEQCDKIKNVVTEATQNEEEARSNAEKFKGIKEENTKLLDLLNKTKDIYWEMERILRIIEIDKEYDNTDNELENLKINVKDLIDKLRDNTSELEKYDSVKETVSFYDEALKDAVDFIGGEGNASKKDGVGVEEKEEEVPFSFDDNSDFNLDFDTDIFGSDDDSYTNISFTEYYKEILKKNNIEMDSICTNSWSDGKYNLIVNGNEFRLTAWDNLNAVIDNVDAIVETLKEKQIQVEISK